MRKAQAPKAHSSAPQKDRAVWFYRNVAYPLRDATPLELEKFWWSQTQADIHPEHRWTCVGPNNIAGRVTALVIHPNDPKNWFAGSATGGVWVTRDAGETWQPTWSRFRNQNIGALAWTVFPGALTLVAATGEANMSGDSYPGSGMYFSSDEGLTWQPFFGLPPGQKVDLEANVRSFPRRIGSMAFRGAKMALGSVFLDDNLPGGLYLCDVESGKGLLASESWGRRSYNCHAVLFHPAEANTLLASIEPGGSLNGIWRSTDFGANWERLAKGLPAGDEFGRTSLAFAPSDPDVIYALAANRRNHVLGLFRSRDGGKSWREILGGRYPTERQISYNNAIAVHPGRPDSVVWGGMKVYRTDDAGRHWRRITNTQRGRREYVHGDHHALLWYQEDEILSANDGGVAITRDGGRTWQERSRGMVTTMFYDLDVSHTDGKAMGGGTQDNGTLIAGVGGAPEGDWIQAIPGDGAWIVFDPAETENVFACATGFQVFHHRAGKPWDFAGWKQIKPKRLTPEETAQREFTVMAIEPSTRPGEKTVWAGSNRLWRTKNSGRSWTPVSGSFDGTPVSAIDVSRARPRLMFVGTTGGGIFRSKDGGATWSQNLAGADIPARAITSIQTHPKQAATVVATVAASGMSNSGVELSTGKDLAYGHVFRSRDMGDTWEDIDNGELPNVVYYAAAYQTEPPYQLFIGGDVGVWAATEKGWVNISGNLPCVVVSDLLYHRDGTLTAATYGRGVWRIRPGAVEAAAPAGWVEEEIPLAAGLRVDPSVAAPVQLEPADGAVIDSPQCRAVAKVAPVAGAMGYQTEFAVSTGFSVANSSTTPEIPMQAPEIQMQQPDERGGRWRVWAILPDGLRSAASGWRKLSFKTPGGS